MISVTGSEIVSALWRSSANIFSTALPALAPPNCSMRSSGWAFCEAAVVASDGINLVLRLVGIPGDLEVHEGGVTVP